MPTYCSDIPLSDSNNCTNPWGEDCTSKAGFQFTSLWNFTRNILAACANDTRLFLPDEGFATPQNASLTQESCAAIAGSGWTYYPTPDIWNRLTTWKFPLLQLVASFPRPPLSFNVECLVILHLLGDPIDTMKNLTLKMSICQSIALHWKKCGMLPETPAEINSDGPWEDRDRNWKALAIITEAYGEWNEDRVAQTAMEEALFNFRSNAKAKDDFMKAVRQTGRALAADRSTKFLPIIVALLFFIGAVAIALFRTAASAGHTALSDTVFINVEAHSIAFSAQYFWIIPAVFLSSMIGVSQTEAAIPRILRRFQADLDRLNLPKRVQMPNHCLKDLGEDQRRIFYGGTYSWQPSKWQSKNHLSSKSRTPRPSATTTPRYEPLNQNLAANSRDSTASAAPSASITSTSCQNPPDFSHALLAYAILILSTVTGMIVSGLVPPDGFDCRHLGQLSICAAWIISALADLLVNYLWPLSSNKLSTLFWMTVVKDFVITVATMGGVIVTQVGVFNRCSCYTLWGKTGLALPERPDIAQTLFHRLNTVYPAVTFTSIGIMLVIVPLYLCTRYRDALRVFVQRDDRRSNREWLWKARSKLRATQRRLRKILSWFRLGRSKPQRAGTTGSAAEQGDATGSQELQTLTQPMSEEPEAISSDNEGRPADEISQSTSGNTQNAQSESSSVEPPLPSGSNPLPRPEPRRRNTEQQEKAEQIRRKPVPTASPLQRSQYRSL
ncbi:MAG: hypothetical protein Q9191_001950 [Dirinaria sp. TL-2023a]